MLQTLIAKLDVKSIYWVDDENATQEELGIEKLVDHLAHQLVSADSNQQKAALSVLVREEASRSLGQQIQGHLNRQEEGQNIEERIIGLLTHGQLCCYGEIRSHWNRL